MRTIFILMDSPQPPPYDKLDPEHDDQETIDHIRKSYAGSLTMEDKWLGKFLDKMDEYDIEKDPEFKHPLKDTEIEKIYEAKMEKLLKRYEAPECQYERLNLK